VRERGPATPPVPLADVPRHHPTRGGAHAHVPPSAPSLWYLSPPSVVSPLCYFPSPARSAVAATMAPPGTKNLAKSRPGGYLIAVIGDADTVAGFLMAGVGERDGKKEVNYFEVDLSRLGRAISGARRGGGGGGGSALRAGFVSVGRRLTGRPSVVDVWVPCVRLSICAVPWQAATMAGGHRVGHRRRVALEFAGRPDRQAAAASNMLAPRLASPLGPFFILCLPCSRRSEDTPVPAIEDAFKRFTEREDIAIVLINQYVCPGVGEACGGRRGWRAEAGHAPPRRGVPSPAGRSVAIAAVLRGRSGFGDLGLGVWSRRSRARRVSSAPLDTNAVRSPPPASCLWPPAAAPVGVCCGGPPHLCCPQIANEIRPVLSKFSAPVPAVLEIPSKEHPYDASKDSILQRVRNMLGTA